MVKVRVSVSVRVRVRVSVRVRVRVRRHERSSSCPVADMKSRKKNGIVWQWSGFRLVRVVIQVRRSWGSSWSPGW